MEDKWRQTEQQALIFFVLVCFVFFNLSYRLFRWTQMDAKTHKHTASVISRRCREPVINFSALCALHFSQKKEEFSQTWPSCSKSVPILCCVGCNTSFMKSSVYVCSKQKKKLCLINIQTFLISAITCSIFLGL